MHERLELSDTTWFEYTTTDFSPEKLLHLETADEVIRLDSNDAMNLIEMLVHAFRFEGEIKKGVLYE